MEIAGVKLEELELKDIGSWPKSLRWATLFLVSLVVLFLGFSIDISNVWQDYDNTKQDRITMQSTFEVAIGQAQNLEAYRTQVKTVSQTLETITRQLPNTSEEAGFLQDISNQASVTGLQFRSIKPLAEEKKGFYIDHPVELNLYGTYHSLGEFAANLATLPRIVTLHDLVIKADPKLTGRLDITVIAKTYWTPKDYVGPASTPGLAPNESSRIPALNPALTPPPPPSTPIPTQPSTLSSPPTPLPGGTPP